MHYPKRSCCAVNIWAVELAKDARARESELYMPSLERQR